MEFSVPDKMRELLGTIRQFVQREVYPLEAPGEKSFKGVLPELRKRCERVKELGLWAPQIPKKYGGMGLSFMEHALVSEELGRCPFGHFVFNCQAPDAGNMEILMEFGAEAQKERWLRPLVNGDIRSCFSMTEPEYPGSNPIWMATTAVKDRGDYIINGHKWFTSAADGAAFAIVMLVTDPQAEPHRARARSSCPRTPRASGSSEISRAWATRGRTGPVTRRWSTRIVACPVRTSWARRGAALRLPRRDSDRDASTTACGLSASVNGRSTSCASAPLPESCARRQARKPPERSELDRRKSSRDQCGAAHGAPRRLVHRYARRQGAREEISLIKFYVANVMMNVIDRAIQVHGALGISDDTLLSSFYRNGRAARIYDGADEVHKTVVAKRILRRYGLAL